MRYFTSERDGADVSTSVLGRQPANLTDRAPPCTRTRLRRATTTWSAGFAKIGGPVDVSGGWFDAGGGYEKFAYTASYTDGLMLLAARDFPGRYPTLAPEAAFGLRWLAKLWNPTRKVLYVQVGIGNGNASNTIQGDYNYWFLPQAEDRINVRPGGNPGPTDYYVKYRPVFEAAPPGQKIDPDFAGRFAADFALGAQLAARTDRGRARAPAGLARGVYAMAKTSHVGRSSPPSRTTTTRAPSGRATCSGARPRSRWPTRRSALAARAAADLAAAAHWARAYIAQGHPAGGDTLNLYDNGAIGEAELLQAMRRRCGRRSSPGAMLADMAAQLRVGEARAAGDPFGLGIQLGSGDATPHAFGLYITNALTSVRRVGRLRRPSPSSSSTSPSAPTAGAARSSSAPGARSRTACRARSPTWPAR